MLRASRVVGRDPELRSLSEARGAVVLAGAAGMGKSTLIRALVATVGGAAIGRATPPPSAALRPLSELALALVRAGAQLDDPRLQVQRTALSVLLPDLVDGSSGAEVVSPVQIADALMRLRETAGRQAPPVLVLEDVHWADQQTAAVIEALADAVHGSATTVVVSMRPEGAMWSVARRVVQRRAAALVELAPLGPEDVDALVRACLDGAPPAGLLDAVTVAEGVPLLVEELLAAHEQRGHLRRGEGGWRFELAVAATAVPASVAESVSARLGDMDRAARRVLEAAAILGRDFDVTLLPVALGSSAEDVESALQDGLALGLLASDGDVVRFSHALVRDAVVASATAVGRRSMALRLLSALERRLEAGAELELGAALATSAGERDRAAALLATAGQQHLARGFPGAAVECFDQALAAGPPPASALATREALLQALALAGDVERASREGDVVRRQLEVAGAEPARLRACAEAMARAAANADRWEAAAALLPAGGSSLHALVALNLGRLGEAERLARDVLADAAAPPPHACEAAEVLGRLARRRDLDEAAAWFGRAVAIAELNDLALWRARALHELATIDQLRTLSVTRLEEARRAAIAASAPGLLAAVDFHLAAVYGVRFDADLALAAARRCLDTARRLGAQRQEAWAWNLIGQGHMAAGDWIRARAAAAEALALGGEDAEVRGVAVGVCAGMSSLLAEDRARALVEWTEAIAALRQVAVPTPLPPWFFWPLLATIHDLEGDGGARARAETDTPDLRVASGADALWHLADAVAWGRSGDRAGADAAAERADARFAEAPAFGGYMHVGRRLAADAAIGQGWGQPDRWMIEAGEWFAARDFVDAASACQALARRAGVKGRRAGRGASTVPPHLSRLGITSREVDVLRLVAEGLTNRQIAERLYVSPRTVKGHVENLLAKTGTANRTRLAAMASSDSDGR